MQTIEELRLKIEQIDGVIIKQIGERQNISKRIGELKRAENRDIIDLAQEEKLFKFYESMCKKYNLDQVLIKNLFKMIIASSRKMQDHG